MDSAGPSIEQIKASMRSTWMAGDFGVIAKNMAGAAEQFAERLNVPPGAAALDVACGTGNLAIPLAKMGCVVTGVDLAPNLIAQARERPAIEHVAAVFEEGDAEALPYPDANFDVVVSMFGAMFAPRPEVVAAELARVLKPGGRLAMANWTPGSFTGEMFRVTGRHVPPPPGVAPPVLWGDPATVHERLAPYFTGIQTETIPVDFDLPTNPAGAVAFFRQYFGPTNVAFSRLDDPAQASLASDLEALWASANASPAPETNTLIRNEFLKVTAIRA
jgi:SAM-dependent methyltransferase